MREQLLQVRYGTQSEFDSHTSEWAIGEIGYITDSKRFVIADGSGSATGINFSYYGQQVSHMRWYDDNLGDEIALASGVVGSGSWKGRIHIGLGYVDPSETNKFLVEFNGGTYGYNFNIWGAWYEENETLTRVWRLERTAGVHNYSQATAISGLSAGSANLEAEFYFKNTSDSPMTVSLFASGQPFGGNTYCSQAVIELYQISRFGA